MSCRLSKEAHFYRVPLCLMSGLKNYHEIVKVVTTNINPLVIYPFQNKCYSKTSFEGKNPQIHFPLTLSYCLRCC